jgi:hypothetical protein
LLACFRELGVRLTPQQIMTDFEGFMIQVYSLTVHYSPVFAPRNRRQACLLEEDATMPAAAATTTAATTPTAATDLLTLVNRSIVLFLFQGQKVHRRL